VTDDPRRAGQIQRWHTSPLSRPQSNAEHSWGVARILLFIHPSASRRMIMEALMHDIGEGRMGDIPYPAKRDSPTLARVAGRIEEESRRSMAPWGIPLPRVSPHERWVLKMADMLEMWETGVEEVARGNRLDGMRISRECEAFLQTSIGSADPSKEAVARRVREYMSLRVKTTVETMS